MDGLAEPAYAKINLTLDITGRREDGYHTLRSVLQSISLCDRVFLFSAESGTVTVECDAADVPCGAENTVLRAAG
ncbi:MAG TPA: 4-(cytidine 5'-diphospho)-2-C-methyl-D-erythritol kinase, partial [Ruminococcaceae bacterium]|nr:4-(cytidine 5'-diphospho)-2-C-methyl-D-erythritol kinase [Oscillospiraceae bacterium]